MTAVTSATPTCSCATPWISPSRKPTAGPDRTAGSSRHVTGQELLDGVRRYALEQFGPLVTTVLGTWRVTTTDDFGRLVFNLIDAHIFGRTERDSLSDFCGGYTFYDAFVRPYLPPSHRHEPGARTCRRHRLPAGG